MGCWMRGNSSEKPPVSLGMIPKQYADADGDGGIDSVLLARYKAVRGLRVLKDPV